MFLCAGSDIAYLVLFAIMMMLGAKDYYLAPIYPLLFAAGGAFWSAVFSASHPVEICDAGVDHCRWIIGRATGTADLLARKSCSLRGNFWTQQSASQTGQEGVLPEHFGDEFGWPEMAAAVARVYRGLSSDDRAKGGHPREELR